MLERTIDEYAADDYAEDWDLDALLGALDADLPGLRSTRPSSTTERVDHAQLVELVTEDAIRQYDAREAELGEELMRALERFLLLQIIDERWREHLHDMDYLREGIGLRGFAQIEPLVAYKNEAFTLFEDLMNLVWTDFARLIFHVQVQQHGPQRRAAAAAPARSYQPGGQLDRRREPRQLLLRGVARRRCAGRGRRGRRRRRRGARGRPSTSSSAASRRDEQLGRNDPCWCGSGKKFKRCHGA